MSNFEPLDMDLTTYLTLPPENRKRLAAKRSRERARARTKEEEIPPTIEEELGLKRRKSPKEKKAVVEPGTRKYFDANGKELTHAQLVDRLSNPVVLAPCGEVPSVYRTVRGCLHWVPGYDEDEYKGEALDRGFTHQIPYFNGERLAGRIFCKEISEIELAKIRAIFLASRNVKMRFGKREILN